MSVQFADVARIELLEAIDWYRERGEALVASYLSEIERTLQRIEELPRAWPIVEGEIRQFRLWRFPYAVIYEPRPPDLYVLAIAHARRRPLYWRDRVKDEHQ